MVPKEVDWVVQKFRWRQEKEVGESIVAEG